MSLALSVTAWYLLLALAGPLGAPLGRKILPQSADGGSGLGRIVFLTLWTGLFWLILTLTSYPPSRGWAGLSFLGIAAGCLWLECHSMKSAGSFVFRKILHESLFFLVLSGVFLLLRAFFSAISWSEAFTDFMILDSLHLTDTFPPEDRWLAGYPLNYYYMGQLQFVPLGKVVALPVEIIYNLALASVLPLLAGLLRGTASAFLRKTWQASGYAVWAVFAGTFAYLHMLWRFKGEVHWIRASSLPLSNLVTEYPSYSFLLGDLHAHFVSLPVALAATLVILRWIQSRNDQSFIWAALAGLATGWQAGYNAWGVPLLVLLALAANALSLLEEPRTAPHLRRTLIGLALFLLTAIIGTWLVSRHLLPPPLKLAGVAHQQRSNFYQYFLHWGVLLLPFLGFFAATFSTRHTLAVTVGSLLFSLAIFLIGSVASSLIALLILALASWKSGDLAGPAPWRLLWVAGLGVLLGCEFLALAEGFALYPIALRFNTVFKSFYLVWGWFLLAIPMLWIGLPRRIKALSLAGFAVCLLFFPLAFYARPRTAGPTLDGLSWLRSLQPGEAAVIDWLRQHSDPNDRLVEGVLPGPEAAGRGYAVISTFSGRPAVLGWLAHQGVWRSQQHDEILRRLGDVQKIYTAADPGQLLVLLRQYQVGYVVLGARERELYRPSDFSALRTLPLALERPGIALFRVPAAK